MPSPLRQQESIELGGYRPNHHAVVETRIEAGRRVSEDEIELQPGAPIEVKCDIVQVSSQKVEARGFS